ncbi:MAG TPA: AbrB/MazE/SpoVT family DNA-binding domain-containing protein [Ilumatobacter sp.]|nr:AbrB/MazE/SpoVT family DNA-binding domain-containing protein [Ilumatobacter sp.]
MVVAIDKSGRIVIPSEIRDQLDLTPGTEFDIQVSRDAIVLEPHRPHRARQLAWTEDGRPYFPAVVGREVTDADVQRVRDALQR